MSSDEVRQGKSQLMASLSSLEMDVGTRLAASYEFCLI